MSLTPEDVINKRFQPTKFREGYDQDEVDDFLDEIVVELRRLNQENDDLRKQLETAGTQQAPTSTASQGTASAEATSHDAAATFEQTPAASAAPVAEPAVQQPAAPAASSTPAVTSDSSAESAAGVLAMAQKLHDEYVAQGRSERERLISEGRAQADKLVSDGKRTKEETLSSLEREKTQLEASVNQLRTFERDYRKNLKDYINGQLREIDSTGSLSPSGGTTATNGTAGNRNGVK